MGLAMAGKRARPWLAYLVAGLAAAVVAGAGGAVTVLGPWYYGLEQPPWKPPDWAFGPAWTVIFALIAVAAAKAWNGASDRGVRARVIVAFAVNGVLNFVWSLLFFYLQRPDWALAEVVFLWLSIVALIWVAARTSRAAGWLLAPYLVWVSFAAVLNLAVVRLNGPFPMA